MDAVSGEQCCSPVAPDAMFGFSITPDGSELFFDRATERADLWAMRLASE